MELYRLFSGADDPLGKDARLDAGIKAEETRIDSLRTQRKKGNPALTKRLNKKIGIHKKQLINRRKELDKYKKSNSSFSDLNKEITELNELEGMRETRMKIGGYGIGSVWEG